MTSQRSRTGGFSLVEVIIATVIIAIALFGVLSMTLHTSKTKESMKELEIAKEAANRKIEEIRGLPWITPTGMAAGSVPTVVETYAVGAGLPREVLITGVAPFSVDGLSNPTTTDKKGKGRIFIRGTNPDSSGSAQPAYNLIDYEVRIEWKGVDGISRHTARLMLARDQK